jgi:hypothetical protein
LTTLILHGVCPTDDTSRPRRATTARKARLPSRES